MTSIRFLQKKLLGIFYCDAVKMNELFEDLRIQFYNSSTVSFSAVEKTVGGESVA